MFIHKVKTRQIPEGIRKNIDISKVFAWDVSGNMDEGLNLYLYNSTSENNFASKCIFYSPAVTAYSLDFDR